MSRKENRKKYEKIARVCLLAFCMENSMAAKRDGVNGLVCMARMLKS